MPDLTWDAPKPFADCTQATPLTADQSPRPGSLTS